MDERLNGMQVHLTSGCETESTVGFADEGASSPERHPGVPVIGTLPWRALAGAQLGMPERHAASVEAAEPMGAP